MKQRTIPFLRLCAAALVCCPLAAVSHHSARVIYDVDQTVEMQGEVVEVFIRNPHLHLTLRTQGENGDVMLVDVESIPATRLQRNGVTDDLFRVGDVITVAGFPSRRFPDQMYANNLLLPDGREILLDSPVARWTNNTIGSGSDVTPGQRSADQSLGLFRVWSTDGRFLGFGQSVENLLTDQAKSIREEWDPFSTDNPFTGCTAKGMPLIMQQPNPIEFVNRGSEIVLRMEEYDAVRVIAMNDPATEVVPPRLLGHSYGRWEADTLVVETSGIDYQYFSQEGLMQSEDMHVIERFTVNEDGSRLDYEQTAFDPWLLTAPFTQTKSWVWVPGDQVLEFECLE